jgi:hypothetical protein
MSELNRSVEKELQSLNAICPYFTMFPLSFPLRVLKRAAKGDWILDPFVGRGTTIFAGRLIGLPGIGIDSNPVAAAIANAKMVNPTPDEIIKEAGAILDEVKEPKYVPKEVFWDFAYHSDVLNVLCRLREGLLQSCSTRARIGLRAIILGALHGPKGKVSTSYFSNQCPRTYAPKPNYSVKFWKERKLEPENVDVLKIIELRANRYYSAGLKKVSGKVFHGDSRNDNIFKRISKDRKFSWVVTSPPYYGMSHYLQDQWLRLWFVGGPSKINYIEKEQLSHGSPEKFCDDLRKVWKNSEDVVSENGRLIIRFGGINDRKVKPLDLIKSSLKDTSWKITKVKSAGFPSKAKRQAEQFISDIKNPMEEYDIYAVLK